MPIYIRVIFCVILLFAVGYCVFGYLATYEPPGTPMLRGVYGVSGALALLGIGWIALRGK